MSRINIDHYNKLLADFTKSNQYMITRTGPRGQFSYTDLVHNLQLIEELSVSVKESIKQSDTNIADWKIKQEEIKNTPLIEDVRFKEDGGIYNFITKTFLQELDEALAKCPEYNIPQLAGPLRMAFSNPEIVTLRLHNVADTGAVKGPKAGKQYSPIVYNIDRIAGTPEELALAVKATRDQLDYGNKVTGERATNAWYNGLYRIAREGGLIIKKRKGQSSPSRDKGSEDTRTALYFNIIRTRLEELGNKPAYWYLLNYGNASADRMEASNKGGKGRPSNPPTFFVEKAKNKIDATIIKQQTERPYLSPKEGSYKKDTRYADLTELIRKERDASSELRAISHQLKILKSAFERILHNLNNSDEQMFIALEQFQTIARGIFDTRIQQNKINEKLSIEESQLVVQKLNTFVATILSDKPVPSKLYIISKDNVELRIRTKSIVKDLQKSIQEYQKNLPGKIIEQIFQAMIITTQAMENKVKRDIYMKKVASKGVSR